MDALFPGVAPDEIREWRKHPVTEAFMKTLEGLVDDRMIDLVRCVLRDDLTADREAIRLGGRLDSFDVIKRIIEES